MSAIGPEQARAYEIYLKEKGYGKNHISKKFQTLRSVINEQKDAGKYSGANAFAMVHIARTPVKKEKLTWDEIGKIEKLKLAGRGQEVKALFLFSFYGQGMRFENCVLFKKEYIQGDHLRYRMNKGEKVRDIEINSKLRAIINQYIESDGPFLFPFVKKAPSSKKTWDQEKDSLNALINKYVKFLAAETGIEKKNQLSHRSTYFRSSP